MSITLKLPKETRQASGQMNDMCSCVSTAHFHRNLLDVLFISFIHSRFVVREESSAAFSSYIFVCVHSYRFSFGCRTYLAGVAGWLPLSYISFLRECEWVNVFLILQRTHPPRCVLFMRACASIDIYFLAFVSSFT